MPTQNTWAAVSGLKTTQYQGRVRTWARTPNFGSIPKDEKPVNPYEDWNVRAFQAPKYWTYNNGGAPIVFFNNTCLYTGTEITNDFYQMMLASEAANGFSQSSLQNASIVKVLGKISDAKVNVAVALAEATRTSNLILDVANRIDRSYRAFRRGNLREVARLLNITPGRVHRTWLEYKYGWMPLLMDVKNGAEFLAQQHIGRPPRFTCTAVETRNLSYNRVSARSLWGSVPAVYSGTESITSTFQGKTKVWCELENPHLSAAQQLGITNPTLIVWELVPYSFVFDWFISVGNYLQALTALHGVKVRRAMYSLKITNAYFHSLPGGNAVQGGYTYSSDGDNYGATNAHYFRSIPNLSPESIYPPKNESFSFQKLITSLALIKGSYRGDSRTARI